MRNGYRFRVWFPRLGRMMSGIPDRELGDCLRANGATANVDGRVMLSTGLKDFRGVEIYENDLVDAKHWSAVRRVVWQNGAFHHKLGGRTRVGERTQLCGPAIWDQEIVVVGNIFETPELTRANCQGLLTDAADALAAMGKEGA